MEGKIIAIAHFKMDIATGVGFCVVAPLDIHAGKQRFMGFLLSIGYQRKDQGQNGQICIFHDAKLIAEFHIY